MANLYDLAYDMEKAIRESNEYMELKALFAEVKKDDIANKMFENFRDVQLKLQEKQMSGAEISPEEVEQAQKMFQLVQQNPTLSRLIAAEQRMSMLIAELNKIITRPLEEIYGPIQQ